MDFIFLTFLFVALSVLVTLCLFVIEYQNSRTRRLNQIWSERLGAFAAPSRRPRTPSEQHAA